MTTQVSEYQTSNLYEVVLNTVSEGITIINKDLRVQYQNKVITQLYGTSLIGEHCYRAFRGRAAPCEDCKIIEVLKDGQERRLIRDVTLPNGSVLLVELISAAIKDAQGNIISAVEIARDVTEQKKG